MKSNKGLLTLASLLAVLGIFVIGLVFAQRYIEDRVRAGVDAAVAKNASTMEVTYRNVKVNLLRRTVDVNGLRFKPLEHNPKQLILSMDRIRVSDIDDASLLRMALSSRHRTIPNSLRFSLQGMHFTGELVGEKVAQALSDFGYDELNLSVSAGLKTDRQARTLALDDVNIEMADAGKLSTTWQFADFEVPTDEELENPKLMSENIKSHMLKASLHYADLRFEDHNLLAHINAKLKKDGKPSLADSAKMLNAFAGRSPAKVQFLNDAGPKLQSFLANGGTLALKAQPPKDLTIVQLANPLNFLDPNAFASQLGLSLEATH